MPMKDLQARAAKVGRIRTGISVIKDGKQRPEKLTRFLLTTESRHVADAIAEVYGGKVDPFHPMGGAQRGWQVLVDIDEIPVAVPPGEQVLSQWWEMWTAGGLQRRCDGETASVWEGTKDNPKPEQRVPCKCPADLGDRAAAAALKTPKACRPSTRVSLILPDVPGTGTFMVESHGIYAAQELGGVAELMHRASSAGVILPAVLRLEQREGVRRPGQTTNRFAVPVLQLQHSMRELLELAERGPSASALPPAPRRALTAGSSPAGSPPRPAGDTARALPSSPVEEGTAQQDLAPDPPPGPDGSAMSAQQIAARALSARSKPVLDALGRTAAELGLLEEFVDDGTGVMTALQDVLHARLDAVKAAS